MRISSVKQEEFNKKLSHIREVALRKGYVLDFWKCNGFKPRKDKNPIKVRSKIKRSEKHAFSTFTFGVYRVTDKRPRYSSQSTILRSVSFSKWSERFDVIDKLTAIVYTLP